MKYSHFFLKIEYFVSLLEKDLNHFLRKIECFEDISNLQENLTFSVKMLGFFPVKSGGSKDRIGYG